MEIRGKKARIWLGDREIVGITNWHFKTKNCPPRPEYTQEYIKGVVVQLGGIFKTDAKLPLNQEQTIRYLKYKIWNDFQMRQFRRRV